ncbi:MAG: hypothetical protein QNJ84_13050 [Alphaproteobacteria bacterium]|nr:hypothetical protein [Alphaproteobacteria bacterium]
MVSRVSTIGVLQTELAQIQRQNAQFSLLNNRVATGQEFRELKNYGVQAPQILDLRQEITSREGYNRAIDLADINIGSYDETLGRMIDLVDDLIRAADPLSTEDTNFQTNTETISVNLMIEVTANLNIEIGDRFLFAGTRFDQAPLVDLRTLALYTANDIGVVNTIETADDIPTFIVDSGGTNTPQSYHTQGPNTVDSQSYDEAALTIADDLRLTYGITANEPAFQNVIEALVRLRSSAQAGLTEAERESFLTEAQLVAQDARDQLRQLQSENGLALNRLRDQRDTHTSFINISQIALDNITRTDDATAAAEISALTAQVQASFSTIANRRDLSLVNFL